MPDCLENKQIKDLDNRLIAILTLLGITLCFASVNLLEADTINHLKEVAKVGDLVSTVPGAFQRYLLFLIFSLVAGVVIVFLDKGVAELSKSKVIFFAIILGVSLSWIALSRVLQFPICGDDTYIDLRYIRNWIDGTSFDYNPGHRVIGFTSHLHLILLYLAKLIFFNVKIDVITQMMNAFFQILNLGILYFFLKDIFEKRSAALAGIFAYAFDTYGIQQTIFGKESHILVFLLILSIWAMHHKRYHVLAILSSLMPFVRPEAIVWWLFTLVWSIRENRRKTFKYYITPLAIVVLVIGLMYSYFGTVVPHGMVAKFKMFYPDMPGFTFTQVMRCIGTGIFIPRYFWMQPEYFKFLSLLFYPSIICAIVTLTLSLKIFRNSILKWYVFAVIFFVLVFSVKNVGSFSWYHCWYFLLPAIFMAAMIPRLFESASDKTSSLLNRGIAAGAIVYLVFVQLAQQIMIPVPNLTSITFRLDPEFHRIVQLGRAYNRISSYPGFQSSTIGAPEIGYLGFIHKGKILDFCGLVSPEVLEFGPPPLTSAYEHERHILEINPRIIEKFQPEYIITLESFGREMAKDSFFKENYKEIAWLENDWAHTKGINVYKLSKKIDRQE